MPKTPSEFLIEQSPAPRYDAPPRIDESVLCIGDCQIPYHDAEFINNVKRVALAFGVKAIALVGDVFDFHALSIFLSQANADLNKELDADEYYFQQLVSGFDKKILVIGNHEYRLSRMLGQYLNAERLKKLLGLGADVVVSNYAYLHIGNEWQASHPKNASVIPARVPTLLAEKYRRHTISFHGHLTGTAQTRDGLIAIDAGITCDPMRLEYTAVTQNTRPVMTQGAVILLKRREKYYPRIFNKFTDWDFEIESGAIWQSRSKNKRRRAI